MTKTNYSVTTVIGHGILGKLAGDFRVVLQSEVVEVTQVDEPGLGPIILPQLRWLFPHPILILLPLIWGA